jgi:hypothetical protein
VLTQTALSRHTAGHLALLQVLDPADPDGDLSLIADHLASHLSAPIRDWLADHPRIQQAFMPVGAAWLNLLEGWWRLFRRNAFAGASQAHAADIAYVTRLATAQLNRHAQPWIWGVPRLRIVSLVDVSCTIFEERRSNPLLSRKSRELTASRLAAPWQDGCRAAIAPSSRRHGNRAAHRARAPQAWPSA